jgi:hypothetical protein
MVSSLQADTPDLATYPTCQETQASQKAEPTPLQAWWQTRRMHRPESGLPDPPTVKTRPCRPPARPPRPGITVLLLCVRCCVFGVGCARRLISLVFWVGWGDTFFDGGERCPGSQEVSEGRDEMRV